MEVMKYIIFADLHIKNLSSVYMRGDVSVKRGPSPEHAYKALEEIFRYAGENGIREIFFLGDFFDNREVLSTSSMYSVVKTMSEIVSALELQHNVTLWCLPGNHDIFNKEGSHFNSLHVLTDVNFPVNLCDSLRMLPIESNVRFFAAPWGTSIEEIRGIDLPKDSRKNVLLGHLAVSGAKLGAHEYQIQTSLDPMDLDMFDLVLLGHFHEHQILSEFVHYVGSPWQTKRGESYDKGFYVFDSDKFTCAFIHIDLSKHIKLKISSHEDYVIMKEEIIKYLDHNDLVDLVLPYNCDFTENLVQRIKDECNITFEAEEIKTINLSNIVIDGAVSQEQDIITQYVAATNIVDKKDKLISIGQKLQTSCTLEDLLQEISLA